MSAIGQITQSDFETIIVPLCESICRRRWSRLPLAWDWKKQYWDEFLNFTLASVFRAIVRTNADIEFSKQVAGNRCKFAISEFAREIFGRRGDRSGIAIGSRKSVFAHSFTDYDDKLHDGPLDSIEDRSNASDTINPELFRGFTKREIKICQLLIEGYLQREIGEIIGVSESRVVVLVDLIRRRMLEQDTLNCQAHMRMMKGKKKRWRAKS